MNKNKTLQELFSFPGFKATKQLQGKFGDPKARIIVLGRQKKLLNVLVVINATKYITIARFVKHAIWMPLIIELFCAMKDGEYVVGSAKVCAWKS